MKLLSRRAKTFCFAMYGLALASGLCYLAMRLSTSFAEFFNNTVSAASRRLFVRVTDPFPFSVAEVIVLAIPLFVGVVIWRLVVQIKRNGGAGCVKICAILLAILSFFLSTFVLNGAAGYFGVRIADKLEISSEPTDEELFAAGKYLADEVAVYSRFLETDETGATVMPYSVGECAYYLSGLYESLNSKYHLTQTFRSNPKILATSDLVTYTHISGLFCDYTAEMNINVNYPDFVVCATVAHEMAHQRGVAPEDEANFIAYAVSAESTDPYIRYSGALEAFRILAPYMNSADKERYADLYYSLGSVAVGELSAYSAFFERYQNSKAAEVAENVNDAYLRSQGTRGTVAYSEAAYLIVGYVADYRLASD